jgi:hypothetical protein
MIYIAVKGKLSAKESVYNIVSTKHIFVGSTDSKVVMPVIDPILKVLINPIFVH